MTLPLTLRVKCKIDTLSIRQLKSVSILISQKPVMFLIFSLLLVSNVLGHLSPRIDPLVETNLGLIRGVKSEDGRHSIFLGIPYAVVDEDNPFAPSVPHGGFNDTFNAYDGSIVCPQTNMDNQAVGQLQCLTLNVFVPNSATTSNPLPVMVHIHGGAFNVGSGGTEIGSPDYLVEKGIVYVSINYRLGIYGFFCTDSPKAPGNIGLKDQLLALRWVKNNIASFGGNPHKITVLGESAGSMSIHLHLLSPHEKLFHGAIMESGPATTSLAVVQKDNTLPLRLAENLGYVTENVEEALDFIAAADVNLATAAGNLLKSPTIYSNEPLLKACVEQEFDGIERFVTKNPNDAKVSKSKLIPIIIGHASQELSFFHGVKPADFFDNYSFKDLLSFGYNMKGFDEMAKVVKQFYIGDEKPSTNLAVEITNFASDFGFNYPVQRAIRNLLDSGAVSVYHYVFSYDNGKSYNYNITGAGHASEVEYFLKRPNSDSLTDDDKDMIAKMTTLWTNFAKYGVPVVETNDILPVKWEPVTKETDFYYNIDRELSLLSRPFHVRMAFWDVFYELNVNHTLWFEDSE